VCSGRGELERSLRTLACKVILRQMLKAAPSRGIEKSGRDDPIRRGGNLIIYFRDVRENLSG